MCPEHGPFCYHNMIFLECEILNQKSKERSSRVFSLRLYFITSICNISCCPFWSFYYSQKLSNLFVRSKDLFIQLCNFLHLSLIFHILVKQITIVAKMWKYIFFRKLALHLPSFLAIFLSSIGFTVDVFSIP